MSRGLSTAAKAYTGPMVWLLDLTTPAGVSHYFCSGDLPFDFGGNSYLPYLNLLSGVSEYRSMQVSACQIELLTGDSVVLDLLKAQTFEGSLAILRLLFRDLGETYDWRMTVSEQEEGEAAGRFRLVSDFDPNGMAIPVRAYSQLCVWRFATKPCNYDPASITFTEQVAERTADVFGDTTIGDTGLSETVNAHADRAVVITTGTGVVQVRRIRSNTATVFTLYGRWTTNPDGTSKFKVFSFANGIPKLLVTATSGDLERTADVHTATTIGDTGLAMTVNEHSEDFVRITSGTGSGQQRLIGSNTATVLTLDSAAADFSPVPDATSVFSVYHNACAKTLAECEDRAQLENFGGFPTLTPDVVRIASGGANLDGNTSINGPYGSGAPIGDVAPTPIVDEF